MVFTVGGATLATAQSSRTKAVAGPSKNRSTSRKQATPILLAPAKAGSIVQTRRSHTSSASASSSRTSSQRNIKREVDLPLPPPAYYEHQPCSCQGGTQHLCIPCKTSGPSPSYRSYSTKGQRMYTTKLYRKRSASPSLPTLSEDDEY